MKIRTKFLVLSGLAFVLLSFLFIVVSILSFRDENTRLYKKLFDAKISNYLAIASSHADLVSVGQYRDSTTAYERTLDSIRTVISSEPSVKTEEVFTFIIDNKGLIVFIPELAEQSAELASLKFISEALASKRGQAEFGLGGKKYWAVYNTFDSWGWTFFLATTDQTRNEGIVKLMTILVILAFAIIIGFILLTWIFIGSTLKPLQAMGVAMGKVAEGQGDLRSRITVVSKDEVGGLARYFNSHVAAIERIIVKIKKSLANTARAGEDLSASSAETFASLEEIRANIEGMRNKIVNLDVEINSVNGQIDILKTKIGRVTDLVANQSSDIEESSSAITEMTASIDNVAKTSDLKLAIVENLTKSAASGEQFMRKTIDTITTVTKSTSVILDMVKVIKTISAQTNLLAMNAAIEAAHAGDYGRGFSVVADEIRKLADDASKNSKEITTTVKDVNVRILESADISNKTGVIFKTIVGEIEEVSWSMAEIKNTMSELSAAGGQILTALGSMINSSEEIKTASHDMHDGINSITHSTDTVSNTSGDIRNAMEEVSSGIKDIYNAVRIASEGSEANADNIRQIDELVRQFQVNEEKG